MTTPAEDALYARLTDIESLEALAKIGLDLEAIPTAQMRPVVQWAIDYYFDSGRRQAPSRALLTDTFADVLEAADVMLTSEEEETDTIESAISHLNDLHADRQWQTFIKDAATQMASAPPTTKVETLTEVTNRLFEVTNRLQDHSDRTLITDGYHDALADYERRVFEGLVSRGMTFGLPPIDEHTAGIHPGELCVLAAGPKVGKSYALDRIGLEEWKRERRVVLYTLENTVEMTVARIACMHLGISPRQWQRGTVPPEKVEEFRKFTATLMDDMGGQFHVISPPRGRRTPEMLIRDAKMLGAESVLIDQLSHVEHPDPGRKAQHELFYDNVHDLKLLIGGRDKVSLLLAHQINREGVKAAEKAGHHEMYHLAGSAGVERAADWVMTMYQSDFMRTQRYLLWQIVAARRADVNNWELVWDVESNGARVHREVSLS